MCQARRVSDQMHCTRCHLIWDVNDPDPPVCQPHQEATSGPTDVAIARAACAYELNRSSGPIEAMRAALATYERLKG